MTQSPSIPQTSIPELLERYDAFLIDAYGVLIHRDGAFDGAAALIDALERSQTPYYVVTNDASRSAETAAAVYTSRGVPLSPEHVITSGSLIPSYFEEHQLAGARCAVLGPQDSQAYVQQAGGEIVSIFDTDDIDVLVICDDDGYPFLETIEATMSTLFRRFDAGKETHMVLANPDLIYQINEQNFGLASGSIALILEHALQLRYLHENYRFTRLGKPYSPIFAQAEQRTGTHNMIMLGDQLRTDILGANRYGIDSALVGTGLTQLEGQTLPDEWRPTYLLPSLI